MPYEHMVEASPDDFTMYLPLPSAKPKFKSSQTRITKSLLQNAKYSYDLYDNKVHNVQKTSLDEFRHFFTMANPR